MIAHCALVDYFQCALRSLPRGVPQVLFAMLPLTMGVCSQNCPAVTHPRFLVSNQSRLCQVSNQSRRAERVNLSCEAESGHMRLLERMCA